MADFVSVVILVSFIFCRKYGFLDDWLLILRHKSVIEYIFGIRNLLIIISNIMYDTVVRLIPKPNYELNYNNLKQNRMRCIGAYLEKLMVS